MIAPHLDFPIRTVAGRFALVEQDSPGDVAASVLSILHTPIGWREDFPDIGIEDPVFTQAPVDVEAIEAQLEDFEPRFTGLVTERPDAADATLRYVGVRLAGGEE